MSLGSRHLGALLYPGFEMLDFFGPLELFSVIGTDKVRISTVAQQSGPVAAAIGAEGPHGPRVIADYGFADAPAFDILLVPGGAGTRRELGNATLLAFLRERCAAAELVASVCTGSALLARAGVLDGCRATSNKQVFALATAQSDRVHWIGAARWVEDGKFFTSSGVSAGMDMALAIISRLWGEEQADLAASYTEYIRHRDPTNDPFAAELNLLAREPGMI